MCQSGNQTVTRFCRHAIIKALDKLNPSNQEMRAVLKQNDGCMMRLHMYPEQRAIWEATPRENLYII